MPGWVPPSALVGWAPSIGAAILGTSVFSPHKTGLVRPGIPLTTWEEDNQRGTQYCRSLSPLLGLSTQLFCRPPARPSYVRQLAGGLALWRYAAGQGEGEAGAHAPGWVLEHQRAALELGELAADGEAKPDATPTAELALDLEERLKDAHASLGWNAATVIDHPNRRRVVAGHYVNACTPAVDERVGDQVIQD